MIVQVEKGTHHQDDLINKQLADKERVCAAEENPHILEAIKKGIQNTDDRVLMYLSCHDNH